MNEQNPEVNLYAPPQARVEDVQEAGELELADRGTRLAAVLLDGLCFAGVGIVAAIFIPIFANKQGGSSVGAAIAGIVVGVVALAILIINCVLLHRNGQTIGKKVLKIKVVRSNGDRIGLTRIFFLRFLPIGLLGAIPFIGGFISLLNHLLIFRESRQCLHDNIADTIVVRT